MDENGSILDSPATGQTEDESPIDWTEVKIARKRRWETRPVLSQTINEIVKEDLEKHLDEKYGGDDPPKTKDQKPMSQDKRKKGDTNNVRQSRFQTRDRSNRPRPH